MARNKFDPMSMRVAGDAQMHEGDVARWARGGQVEVEVGGRSWRGANDEVLSFPPWLSLHLNSPTFSHSFWYQFNRLFNSLFLSHFKRRKRRRIWNRNLCEYM